MSFIDIKKEIDFKWHKRAQESIAQNALTNSKRPECFIKGQYPTHLVKGDGCFLYDHQGNKYYDFICGLGSNLLGYAHPKIVNAITKGAILGSTISLSSVYEVQLAEKLKEVFPFIGKLRFLKTGTEACLAAIRVARAKTGRTDVLSDGYHGWSDPFVSLTCPATGCTADKHISKFSDPLQIGEQTAAVILEPVITDDSLERRTKLREIKERCEKVGALLIFDEVITGMRVPSYSFANHFAIKPDLICLGKALGNGMPISVLAGKPHVLDDSDWFVSSTFAGELSSIFAADTVIDLLRGAQDRERHDVEYLWQNGNIFFEDFNKLYPEKLKIEGYGTRGVFTGDPLVKALFWQECIRAGILFGPSVFISFPILTHLPRLLNVFDDILTRIKTGHVQLKGEMPQTPFSQKVRSA